MNRSLIRGCAIISFIILLLEPREGYTQDDALYQSIRFAIDNDFLNYRGNGTDRYYLMD